MVPIVQQVAELVDHHTTNWYSGDQMNPDALAGSMTAVGNDALAEADHQTPISATGDLSTTPETMLAVCSAETDLSDSGSLQETSSDKTRCVYSRLAPAQAQMMICLPSVPFCILTQPSSIQAMTLDCCIVEFSLGMIKYRLTWPLEILAMHRLMSTPHLMETGLSNRTAARFPLTLATALTLTSTTPSSATLPVTAQ